MFSGKRFIVCSLLGFLCGVICYFLASSSGQLPPAVAWQLIFSRALIGFAIGVSSLNKVHWTLHGTMIGILFSIPLAFSGLMAPEPEFTKSSMFIFTIVLGGIYGFLIELIASILLKMRVKAVI